MTDLADVRPVRRYYLGETADPYDALSTVAWTEIPGTKVKTTNLRWGARHELAQVEPRYVSLVLDNRQADFEPLNPSSPYYPNLRPLNRLRIIDTWASVDYIRFTGYVVDWPRSWTGWNNAWVTIEAYDALGAVLNAIDIPGWAWELEIRKLIEEVPEGGKAVWLRLNETTGTVAVDSSGYNRNGQHQGSPTLGVDGLTPDGDKAFSPGGSDRVSLADKSLISGYPWTFACLFRLSPDRSKQKIIFYATDGPSATPSEYIQIFVEGDPGILPSGSVGAAILDRTGTQRRVHSNVEVDTGVLKRLVVVFASPTDFKIYIDTVDTTTVATAGAPSFPMDLNTGYAIGNTPAVTFGDFGFASTDDDVLDEVLIFDGVALTAAQVDRLYQATFDVPDVAGLGKSGSRLGALLTAVGWPTADITLDTGLTTIQQGFVAGKLLSYMQRVDVTEGGRLFVDGAGEIIFHDRHHILKPPYTVSQATFGEGAGEIGYVGPFNHGEDDLDIYNDVPVGNVGGTVQVARNKASKDRYGWKTLTGLTDLLGTSDEEAKDRANRDLAIYSEPVTRIRQLIVKPQEDAAQGTTVWPALLGLGQSSRVTVKAQPPGAPLITQESHVERMEETVTPTDWQITLGLSSAETQAFGIWGTSTWGSARWSY